MTGPTPTPSLSLTPTPTIPSNSAPTPTPTFTVTPTPTNTPTPTPTPDTTNPYVLITYPINGSNVSRNSNLTITANASDSSGINRVEFYVNNSLECTDYSANYSCNWHVPVKKNVNYTIRSQAYDTVGNSSSYTVVVTSK